jgi:ABC-2 type transport system permease protein
VIYLVFAEILDAGEGVRNYPAYILVAFVIFQYFLGIVTGCLTSLVDRASLLRKIRFPRLVVPLAVTLGSVFELLLTFAAVLIFLLISEVYPTWSWVQLVPLLAIVTVFGVGLGLLFSVLFVRFRDMKPMWDVAGQMLFYASPVLYVATMVPDDYRELYLTNPIASVLTQMRHAVVDDGAPTAAAAIGGTPRLLIPLGIVLVIFALGAWAFAREAPHVAENL